MLRLSVGGDAEGGYLVDIHDGTKSGTYNPQDVGDDHGALASAIHEHDPDLGAALGKALGGNPESDRLLAEAGTALTQMRSQRDEAVEEATRLRAENAALKTPKATPGETGEQRSEAT